jgi:hypothetical protein
VRWLSAPQWGAPAASAPRPQASAELFFPQFAIYKGKAALQLSPIAPTWSSGTVKRQGTVMLTAAPARGTREHPGSQAALCRGPSIASSGEYVYVTTHRTGPCLYIDLT